MDDDIRASRGNCAGQGARVEDIDDHGGDASGMQRVCSGCRASRADDMVPGVEQQRHQALTNGARGSCQENLHEGTSLLATPRNSAGTSINKSVASVERIGSGRQVGRERQGCGAEAQADQADECPSPLHPRGSRRRRTASAADDLIGPSLGFSLRTASLVAMTRGRAYAYGDRCDASVAGMARRPTIDTLEAITLINGC